MFRLFKKREEDILDLRKRESGIPIPADIASRLRNTASEINTDLEEVEKEVSQKASSGGGVGGFFGGGEDSSKEKETNNSQGGYGTYNTETKIQTYDPDAIDIKRKLEGLSERLSRV